MMQTTQHEKQTTAPERPPYDPYEESPVPYKEDDIGDANASSDDEDESVLDGGGG